MDELLGQDGRMIYKQIEEQVTPDMVIESIRKTLGRGNQTMRSVRIDLKALVKEKVHLIDGWNNWAAVDALELFSRKRLVTLKDSLPNDWYIGS